jgi:CelD/BcsL family acetyltransferase involved in cellulose biosynthesis
MSGVGVEVVKSIARLEALAPEWAALWQRVPATTPFQSPAWLVPWWRHFRPGRLSTVGLWRAGRLTGVLPLYHADESPGGNLRLLGGGNTDYLDALVEPGCARELGPVIGEALAQIREPDEAVRLERLPAWSPLACVEGDFDRGREDEPCPVLDLPHGSRSCWKDARYLLRRLGRMDGFAIRTAGGDDLGVAIDCLAALHASRWADRGMPGIFADPTNAAFLREAAAALLDAGVLRCHLLQLQGRVVAAHLGMVAKGRAYHYIAGFHPAVARLSPGSALLAHAIEDAERNGARAFDFLRGAEDYKYHWGAEDQWTQRLVSTHTFSTVSSSG